MAILDQRDVCVNVMKNLGIKTDRNISIIVG